MAAVAMAGGELRCARTGATTVGFYSRYACAVAYSLHVEATVALRCGTTSLSVRAGGRFDGAAASARTPRGAQALRLRCGLEVRAVLTHTMLTPKLRVPGVVRRWRVGDAWRRAGACDVTPERPLGLVRALCPCLLVQFSKLYM
jgi:hypothetical protein